MKIQLQCQKCGDIMAEYDHEEGGTTFLVKPCDYCANNSSDKAKQEGYKAGQKVGIAKGYDDGYDYGYDDGYEDGRYDRS